MPKTAVGSIHWKLSLLLLVSSLHLIQSQTNAKQDVSVVSCEDNVRYRFSDGLCAVQKGENWGFIDTTGILVIPFGFLADGNEIPMFHEGRCAVCQMTESGETVHWYIDKKGKPLFKNLHLLGTTSFSEGIALVEVANAASQTQLLLIDSIGRPLKNAALPGLPPGMKLVFNGFHEGLSALFDDRAKAWGYIDTKGKWALLPNPTYRSVGDFHEGMAFVQDGRQGKWGAINSKGELTIPFIFSNRPGDFSNGLASVRNEEDKIGYMDKTGNLVVPYRYDPVLRQTGMPFYEGNAIVLRDGIYYSISINGVENAQVGDSNSEMYMLQNGLVAFKKWTNANFWSVGLLRTNGEMVLKPNELLQIGEFGNGLAHAVAKIGGLQYTGFVNLDANFVILTEN